jgi:hypothetical protein
VTRRFAVYEIPGESTRLVGGRPLVVVEASGPAASGVATALEQVARRLRLDVRRASRLVPADAEIIDLKARQRAGGR